MEWVKAGHIISVIAWMAMLLYLPRLFVYHAGCKAQSAQSETFKVMERRLYFGIGLPASLLTWGFGLWLVFGYSVVNFSDVWPWLKTALVLGLTSFHFWLGLQVQRFSRDENQYSSKLYRIINELPTILMIIIVVVVVVKPF